MTNVDRRRSYRPGGWFGIFGANASVLLPPSEKHRVTALWELVDEGAGFDEVLDGLLATGLRELPGFVLVSEAAGMTKVVLRGAAVAAFVVDGDMVELAGSTDTTWVERSLVGVSQMFVQVEATDEDEGEDLLIENGLVRLGRVDQPPFRLEEPADAAVGAEAVDEVAPDEAAPDEAAPDQAAPDQAAPEAAGEVTGEGSDRDADPLGLGVAALATGVGAGFAGGRLRGEDDAAAGERDARPEAAEEATETEAAEEATETEAAEEATEPEAAEEATEPEAAEEATEPEAAQSGDSEPAHDHHGHDHDGHDHDGHDHDGHDHDGHDHDGAAEESAAGDEESPEPIEEPSAEEPSAEEPPAAEPSDEEHPREETPADLRTDEASAEDAADESTDEPAQSTDEPAEPAEEPAEEPAVETVSWASPPEPAGEEPESDEPAPSPWGRPEPAEVAAEAPQADSLDDTVVDVPAVADEASADEPSAPAAEEGLGEAAEEGAGSPWQPAASNFGAAAPSYPSASPLDDPLTGPLAEAGPATDDHDGLTRGGWEADPSAPAAASTAGEAASEPASESASESASDSASEPGSAVARLLFSSGDQVDVDRPVLVGRAPEVRRFGAHDQPRLVPVPSPHQEISATHLEVRPGVGADHGSAVVTDLGSTNGTVLVQPGLPPEDLQPGIAAQLVPGAIIDLGDGVTIQVAGV